MNMSISTLGWMFIIFPQSFHDHEHIHTCNDKFGHLSRGGPFMYSKLDTWTGYNGACYGFQCRWWCIICGHTWSITGKWPPKYWQLCWRHILPSIFPSCTTLLSSSNVCKMLQAIYLSALGEVLLWTSPPFSSAPTSVTQYFLFASKDVLSCWLLCLALECDFWIPSPMSKLASSGRHEALDSRSCQFVCL